MKSSRTRNRRGLVARASLLVSVVLCVSSARAHEAPLDNEGCHKDLSVRDYHCHQGPLAGRSFATKSDMLRERKQLGSRQSAPATVPQAGFVASVPGPDTLQLDSGARIRLIGVETDAGRGGSRRTGREKAIAFLRGMVEGKWVRIEVDPAGAAQGHRDHSGRIAAYVYQPSGELVNLELIRSGYAQASASGPFRRLAEFQAAERDARGARRGWWATEGAEQW